LRKICGTAVGWLHSCNDAGDAQQHAHLLIGSTVFLQGDDCAHTIDSNDFIDKVAKQAEDAVRAAMFETLCNQGLNIDPLSLDLAGYDKQAIKHLDCFSTMHSVVHEVQEQYLNPAKLLAEYTRRLASAAEAGQVLTRQALELHALIIATLRPELSFEEVNDFLQNSFVEFPKRRGLVSVAELKANIEVAELAIKMLTKAKTVEDALTHKVGTTIIQGVAGSGKTTAAVQAAREHWAQESRLIWVLSRNARVADYLAQKIKDVFREVGANPKRVKSMSLTNPKWRNNIKEGDRIIVEDFQFCERHDLHELITLSAKCPVSFLGDIYQQYAIETRTAAGWIIYTAQIAGQPNLADKVRCKEWLDLHDDLMRAVYDEDV
jgi:signal recognition particle subunit SEC65